MAQRKSISKKTRFEVFKRDNFTCQYCGKSAPDVILEVDHINPVVNGGDNDIMNLITSCFDCNRGKGKRKLDNKSEIKKQQEQLKELNKKREQLKMMLEWRNELENLDNEKVDLIVKEFEKFNIYPNEIGRKTIKKWLKSYEVVELLDSIGISYDVYFKNNEENYGKVFEMTPRICKNKKLQKENPMLKEMYYIKGILKNRLSYVNEKSFYCLFSEVAEFLDEEDIENIKQLAKECSSFTNFMRMFNDYIDEV